MTDKLSIYNGALRFIKERKLASLTEAREPRRLLDDVWDADGVKSCLQQAQWNFAIKSAQFDYDTGIDPPFGYSRAFEKPSDFVRTAGVCSDEYFRCPLVDYQDNAGYWFADIDVIYVRYVSDDTLYGYDYAKWPPNFTRFVEGWFASQIDPEKVSPARLAVLLRDAKATDAMEEAPGRVPAGSWSSSRHGSRSRERRPRGGNLY